MNTTFIATTLNEEKTIGNLLLSILDQTIKPNEVIIVDGGSTDNTLKELKEYQSKFTNIHFLYFVKKGNRSVGRNAAIDKAMGDIILCSDAGCTLDRTWVEEIIKPFSKKNTEVVAGYYKGEWKNIFQKCLIPYVLVMPDRINPASFLPASRSMAFTKESWKSHGGFDEMLSHNEDYAFARKLRKFGVSIVFQASAIVYWIPRNSFTEAYKMFFRFALGDIESGIFRPKAAVIFNRYFIGLVLFYYSLASKSQILLIFLLLVISIYLMWAFLKNYKYVNDFRAVIYLPMLQLTSDIAVIVGSIVGFIFYIRNLKDNS